MLSSRASGQAIAFVQDMAFARGLLTYMHFDLDL